jgi:hypothetical protein
MGKETVEGCDESWTATDDSMSPDPVQRLRYPPTAQQFAVVRLKHARLATLGLAVSAFSCASFVDSP